MSVPEMSSVRVAVINALRKVTESADLELDDSESFSAHGLDSLDRMSVMVAVEDELGIDVSQLDPAALDSVSDYAKAIMATPA